MDARVLDEVRHYWFGDAPSATEPPPKERQDMWFRPTEAIDSHVRDTFSRHLDAARAFPWKLAELSAARQVALVVLLDQFPRHIWRKSGEAFAYDAKALEIARALVAAGWRRFPHRNAMLGRESTPEELEFLKGGRGF